MKPANQSGSQGTNSLNLTVKVKAIGVVLAGGRSRRMGADKATLSLEGESLLGRSVRVMREATQGFVVISGEKERGRSALADALWIRDTQGSEGEGLGPLEGVRSVIRWLMSEQGSAIDGTILLVAPVDTPLVTSHILKRLFFALHDAQTQSVAHYSHHVLPLALRLQGAGRVTCETLESLSSFRELVSKVPTLELTPDEETRTRLFNVNTPEDWENLRKNFEF